MMANSSPPRRATVSPRRTQACSRSAAAISRPSPTGMAQRVVDRLETVQIETEHRESAAAAGHGDGLFQPLVGTARGWAAWSAHHAEP